ncbi:MAG: hypothetical protein ABMA13_20935 [Chthoniobacteraceae bacterium]
MQLALSAQDQAVLDWLRGFASEVRLIGGAVLARLRGDAVAPARWIAAVRNLRVLGDVLATAKFPGLYASGSTVFFMVGGREVSVELLPGEVFDARLAELAGARVGFDHESLAYDPATGRLADPLRASGTRGLRLTRSTREVAAAFAQLLDGFIESRRLGLERTLGFKRMRNRVFGASGARPEVAEAVCAVLFARLATWTGGASVEEIEAVLKSRLVASSLRTALGINVADAIRAAKAELAGDGAPNPAVWIAALLGADADTAAGGWLRGGDRFDQLRTRAALAG